VLAGHKQLRAGGEFWGEGLGFTVPSLPLGLLLAGIVGTEFAVFGEHKHLRAGGESWVRAFVSPARRCRCWHRWCSGLCPYDLSCRRSPRF